MNKGSTTKGILMKINLIFKIVVIVFSVFLNTSDVFAREVEYRGEEIIIYITHGTLTQVTFPSTTRCRYGSHKGPVVYECQGNSILLFVQPELTIEGKLEYIRLKNGKIYKLKIIRADNNHATDDIVNILDRSIDADVKEKDTRPNK